MNAKTRRDKTRQRYGLPPDQKKGRLTGGQKEALKKAANVSLNAARRGPR